MQLWMTSSSRNVESHHENKNYENIGTYEEKKNSATDHEAAMHSHESNTTSAVATKGRK